MKIVLCSPSLDPEFGGPARSVPNLAAAVAAQGLEVGLWSPFPGPAVLPDCPGHQTLHRSAGNFASALASFGRVDLVHDNGLWSPCHHRIARTCVALQIPRVVSSRGMLEPWALQQKRWKKRIAAWLYQNRDLRSAGCLHATSDIEVESIRAVGFRNPVALIPNGVEMPPLLTANHQPLTKNVRTALFLSRIHPKKGLLNLIEAWRRVSPAGWRLVIVGPDESGHLREVRDAVQTAGLGAVVEFAGESWGAARWQYYRDAELFVLPTFSENFGLAVAEALVCGVPVITTKGAPWPDLINRRCGWWADIGVEPLTAALREATSRTDVELQTMGQCGRAWMERDFSWVCVAEKMKAVYAWMLGLEGKPDCVKIP